MDPTSTPAQPDRSDFRPPQLSLVIPTLGRSDELWACLESLSHGVCPDVEIVIVDQNPDDRLIPTIRYFEPLCKLVYLRQKEANASAARNLGARTARGAWVGFPDDDCKFLPATLPGLRERIDKGDADLLVLKSIQYEGGSSGVLGYDREVSINKATLRHTVAEYAICLRRDLFLAVDGFDPLFGPGGMFPADEGVDLIRRLWLRYGHNVIMTYCPNIPIAHPQNLPYTDKAALRKAYRYAQGRGACFARHWRTTSKRRVVVMLAKACVSPILFHGERRWLGPVNLLGCLRGFFRYCSYSHKGAHRGGTAASLAAFATEGHNGPKRDNSQIDPSGKVL